MTDRPPSELAKRRPSCRDDFEIAIVCALALEFDAVSLIFDEFFDTTGDVYGKARGDQNHYTTGRIGSHDVVLVLLPRMGKAAAAGVTAHLGHSYGNLKLAILAGVCGGVPRRGDGRAEVRLGDVVISEQVVQFDLGRQYPGEFVPRNSLLDSLGRPGVGSSTLLAIMKTEHGLGRLRARSDEYLAGIQSSAREAARQTTYQFPGVDKDRLFPPEYIHAHRDGRQCDCRNEVTPCRAATMASCHELGCDTGASVSRHAIPEHHKIQIVVGNMGSGDVVMKSGLDRDRIAQAHNLVAFEMEGAGMWDQVPCVVVKGIADYADSHKNKEWQPYAAATAAAVSKALLVQYIREDQKSDAKAGSIPMRPSNRSYSPLRNMASASTIAQKTLDDDLGTVWRLRNLPLGVDKATTAELAACAFNHSGISSKDVTVHTLATTTELWGEARRGVATLSIATRAIPPNKSTAPDGSYEWTAQPAGSPNRLLLDTHYRGLTPLNDVAPEEHRFDCIVLPGLARHPLLSWHSGQGGDGFNWVRDALTPSFPGVRVFLYGYGPELTNTSFVDASVASAEALMLILEEDGFSAPTTKPLLFIAHSLGGLILKRLFVTLAGGNERATFMLSMIHAALFFGTPSTAWPVSNILAANRDHKELAVYRDLTDLNEYCKNLEAQFSGVSYLENINMFAYCEAPKSQSASAIQQQLNAAGFFETTIGQGSSKTPLVRSSPIPIAMDKSHWDMVRFTAGDYNLRRVIRQIAEICTYDRGEFTSDGRSVETDMNSIGKADVGTQSAGPQKPGSSADEVTDRLLWHNQWIFRVIEPAQRNQRANQIERQFGHTFGWAFEKDHAIGLATWLRSGSGTYWISGKPGSGKSTFMRFLLDDKRTSELLHDWQRRPREIVASFFFHHRGTHMQKSFEGLLRELLVQLLDAEPRLYNVLHGIFHDRLQTELSTNRTRSFLADLNDFISACGVKDPSEDLREEVTRIVFQDPIKALDDVLDEIFPNKPSYRSNQPPYDMTSVRRAILNQYSETAWAGNSLDRLSILAQQARRSIIPPKPNPRLLHKILVAWTERIDCYGAIKKSLEDHHICEPHGLSNILQKAQGSRVKQSRLEAAMETLLDHQRLRQSLRLKVQLENWTKETLEDGVRRILEQNRFDLRICMIFDALDEYDGRPETIAEFLKYLAKPRPEISKTQARVLFSSRPWPIFQAEFGQCPGFRIHEHTQNDIRGFAAGALRISLLEQRQLSLLTDDIASRARGVFLWVKLVLRDLNARADATSASGEDLMTSLKECLDSLPDELEDYYGTIVQRLPLSTRKETYILLECLSRTTERFFLEDLEVMRACGLSSLLVPPSSKKNVGYATLDIYLRKITGGLIQSVYVDKPTDSDLSKGVVSGHKMLQLIHQTCKEWIKTTAFKHIVLDSEANTTIENGHSYLSRINVWSMLYYSSSPSPMYRSRIYSHFEDAEKTTGMSQYNFVSGLPNTFYGRFFLGLPDKGRMSTLSLAVHGRLWLLLRDCLLQEGSCASATNSEPLFTLLLARSGMQHQISDFALHSRPATDAEILECGKVLIENGYDLTKDLPGVSALLMRMWESPDRAMALKYVDLVIMGLEHSLPVNAMIPVPDSLGTTKVLYMSPPRLAAWIIERQPDQLHAVNSKGQTVLDYLVDPASVHTMHSFGPEWQFELYHLFTAKGCRFKTTSKEQVKHFLDGCATSGLGCEGTADQLSNGTGAVASAMLLSADNKRLEEKKRSRKRHIIWSKFWTWPRKHSKI